MKSALGFLALCFVFIAHADETCADPDTSLSQDTTELTTTQDETSSDSTETKPESTENSGGAQTQEILQVAVTFTNHYNAVLSLHWLNHHGFADLIQLNVEAEGKFSLNTFVGHQFFFTRPGTLVQVGDVFTIQEGQTEYTLPSDALTQDEAQQNNGETCYDRVPSQCKSSAERGDCDTSPGWMIQNCPKSCDRCDLMDKYKRCTRKFLNISEDPWINNFELNMLFEGMLVRGKDYNPTVLSKPPEGPWVVIFDDFIQDAEIEAFLKWGQQQGFKRSTDIGPELARGQRESIVSLSRTSENAWCQKECMEDPLVEEVTNRVESLITIPRTHYENYQLLKYTPGQYYKVHHDMHENPDHLLIGPGPRVLTVFLYLSEVEEGGATNFPRLNLPVFPKKGRVLIWPSVTEEDVYKQDPRTYHEAQVVEKGLKYGSNLWVHTHDFMKSNLWGCSG